MGAPGPGWYDCPTGQSQQRWWDGAAWSTHTRPAGDRHGEAGAIAPPTSPRDGERVARAQRLERRYARATRVMAAGLALAAFSVMPAVATDAWTWTQQKRMEWELARQRAAAEEGPEIRTVLPDGETETPTLALAGDADVGGGDEDVDDVAVEEDTGPEVVDPPTADEGEAVAQIRAPSVGWDHVVVYDTTDAALRAGPGWMPGSAWVGQPGNTVISGHRTTYGAPFHEIAGLGEGDRIEVEVPDGPEAVYEVRDAFIVTPDEVEVTADMGDARLTLTSCHPIGSNAQRYVVQAELVDGDHADPGGDFPRYDGTRVEDRI